jgi:hypothetical protein
MINLQIVGQDKLNDRLQKLSEAKWFDAFIKDVAQATFNEVDAGVAKHSKKGMLERSIGAGAEKVGDRHYRVAVDGQIAPYGIWVHWGSKPHDIRPKDRKSLRFVIGNKFIFSKWVKHPGYSGDPFMVDAARNVLRDFDGMVQQYLKEI